MLGIFLRKKIVITDFKNEDLTTKIRRKKAEKPYFWKKVSKRSWKRRNHQTKSVPKKNYGHINKSNKIAKVVS